MSLTDELRSGNSVFRKFLEENFPILNYLNKKHPQFKRTRELLNIYVPKTIVKYDGTPLECSLIGAAMDYRVRMFFKGFDVRKTVAARGIERPKFVFSYGEDDNMFFFGGPAHHRVGLQFLNDHYGKWRSEFRRRTQLTEAQERELCRDCYLLACYEQVARGMPSSRLPIWQHNGSSIRLLRALVGG